MYCITQVIVKANSLKAVIFSRSIVLENWIQVRANVGPIYIDFVTFI